MLANYLIGLREGMEAALIISILIAYLVKVDQKKQIPKLVAGLVAAIMVSIGLGLLLGVVLQGVPRGTEEIIAGLTSIAAVIFVTWMIFWMSRQSRSISGNLHARLDQAVSKGSLALAIVAFLSVVREGIETSVFMWSASNATGPNTNPLLGAVLGLLTASVIGVLMYQGAIKLNLGKFFKYTGSFLIVVAAGIMAYGVAELQEVGILPFLTQTSYDLSGIVPKDGILDTILRGTISFNSAPTLLGTLVWVGYLAPTAWVYLAGYKKPKAKAN